MADIAQELLDEVQRRPGGTSLGAPQGLRSLGAPKGPTYTSKRPRPRCGVWLHRFRCGSPDIMGPENQSGELILDARRPDHRRELARVRSHGGVAFASANRTDAG